MTLIKDVTPSEPIFSDLDPDLRVDFQGNLIVLTDQEAVNASLENIFAIAPGEMVMDPVFGSDLSRMIGKSVDDATASFIRMVVSKTLEEERRVTVKTLTVEPRPDDAAFYVFLEYQENTAYIEGLFERLVELE